MAADPELAAIPVVLMSARSGGDEPRTARSSNVVDAIRKPFSPDALLAVTAHVLARQGATLEQPVPLEVELERSSGSLAAALEATPPPTARRAGPGRGAPP